MPQSLSNVVLHVVFSTKDRKPFLRDERVRGVMTGYLVGTLQNIHCPSIQIGVVQDHVHILCQLSRTSTIASLVEELKTNSSRRIKAEGRELAEFHWQNGYGVFSVSESNIEKVKNYVGCQDEHHQSRSFQEEFRLLLQRHQVAWDERYVWD